MAINTRIMIDFREKYAMLFDEPVPLQANHWYVAWARISGPSSDCGSSGQGAVVTDDQWVKWWHVIFIWRMYDSNTGVHSAKNRYWYFLFRWEQVLMNWNNFRVLKLWLAPYWLEIQTWIICIIQYNTIYLAQVSNNDHSWAKRYIRIRIFFHSKIDSYWLFHYIHGRSDFKRFAFDQSGSLSSSKVRRSRTTGRTRTRGRSPNSCSDSFVPTVEWPEASVGRPSTNRNKSTSSRANSHKLCHQWDLVFVHWI